MADTRKISITEGLRELKLYEDKILKTISNTTFIGAKKKSTNKVGHFNEDNFVSNTKADYQSIIDLIENRKRIKERIVQSNASTTLEIGGKIYTVAQAIERKNSIEYEKTLLVSMKQQYKKVTDNVQKENLKVETQLDHMIEVYLGRDTDKKIGEKDIDIITTPYKEQNEWELVDPLNLYDKIQQLENEIDVFLADVDVRLSISNAITFIEV